MATGSVKFWDGRTGWIAQSNVSSLPTFEANDRIFLQGDVAADVIVLGASVTFTADSDEPWMGRTVTVL
jgi:hypothetical protein